MALTNQQIAQKWQRNLAGSVESIRDGVNAVTVSPTEKAAAAFQSYLDGVQRAVADGSYQAGLRRVSLDQWKRAMIDKGTTRIATGAAAAVGKVETFLNEFMPYVRSGQNMIANMPRGSFEQNMQRAIAMMEYLHKFKRRAA